MQIPILIEPLPNGLGFRARVGETLSLSAEGTTKQDALSQLEVLTSGRLSSGAEIVPMELNERNVWKELGGFLPVDDLTKEWLEILRKNRRQANNSTDGLLVRV